MTLEQFMWTKMFQNNVLKIEKHDEISLTFFACLLQNIDISQHEQQTIMQLFEHVKVSC